MLMLDVAEFSDGQDGVSKADYIAKVARIGHWPAHKRLLVPTSDIGTVTRLGELRG